jgi:hypothetical protein
LEGYLAVQLLAGFAAAFFLLRGFRSYFGVEVVAVSNRALFKEVGRYFLPSLLMAALFSFQAMMETWIIRHRLPTEQSAAYYLASRFGMIPGYLSGALVAFLFPMVSERHDRGQSTRGLRLQSLGAMLGVGLLVAALLAMFGSRLLSAFAPWRPYVPYASLLWQTALIAVGTGLIALYTTHESACRRFGFLWGVTPVILLEIGGLYSLMGWSFFRPFLPDAVWHGVDGWVRAEIGFVVAFMLASRGVVLLWILLRLFRGGDRLLR